MKNGSEMAEIPLGVTPALNVWVSTSQCGFCDKGGQYMKADYVWKGGHLITSNVCLYAQYEWCTVPLQITSSLTYSESNSLTTLLVT